MLSSKIVVIYFPFFSSKNNSSFQSMLSCSSFSYIPSTDIGKEKPVGRDKQAHFQK